MENKKSEVIITPQSLITEEHVLQALKADKGKEATIIDWKTEDFTKKGDNYASVVTSVAIRYSVQGQTKDVTYVVKLNPCRSFQNFEDLNNVFFTKEAKFYQILLPELNSALELAGKEPLHLPKCLHASLVKGKEQIYYEDLRAKGFQMHPRSKGLTKEHADLVLRELARLHAASYMLQTKSPDEAIETKHEFLQKDFLTYTENNGSNIVQSLEGHITTGVGILKKIEGYGKAVSWLESLRPKLAKLLSTDLRSDRFGSVCHGDCWNNNLLFRHNDKGQPIEVMLLDLQVCRKASFATDLNYLLFTSLNGDQRKPNLANLLSTYYTTYKEVLESGELPMYFTEEELLAEFRSQNTFGAFIGMMIVPAVLMESSEVPDLSGENIDVEKLMQEYREKTMAMLETNPSLKPRFLAIFDELTESGLIS